MSMKLLKKESGPMKVGTSAPKRGRAHRWFAPLLTAGSIALGGCIPSTAPGSDHDASVHDNDSIQPCITIASERETGNSTQRIESTYCDGVKEIEVSTFAPSLAQIPSRHIVEMLGVGHVLVYFDDDVLVMGTEISQQPVPIGASIRAGEYDVTVHSVSGDSVSISISTHGSRLEEGELSLTHPGWYEFNVAPGGWVKLKVYGLSSVEQGDPSVILGVLSETDSIYDPAQIYGNGARFVLEAKRQGDRLVGWTLSRE